MAKNNDVRSREIILMKLEEKTKFRDNLMDYMSNYLYLDDGDYAKEKIERSLTVLRKEIDTLHWVLNIDDLPF
jgi:hypothetical protein